MLGFLFGNTVNVNILRVLTRDSDQEFSINNLAKISKVAPSSCHRIISELSSCAVVNKRSMAGATLISLNKNHYFFNSIIEFFSKERSYIKTIVKEIAEKYQTKEIYLKEHTKNSLALFIIGKFEFDANYFFNKFGYNIDITFCKKSPKNLTILGGETNE